MKKTRSALIAAGSLWLSGCAIERGVALPELSDWDVRRTTLQSLDDWSFTGRIGVVSGDDGFNGRLRWRQLGDRFDASVSGPLGAGAVQIEGGEHGIVSTDNAGAVTVLQDPEAQLEFRYGWTIPVDSLRFWALGIPDPGRDAETEFGSDGTLSRLEQGGWTVDISEYREGGGQLMPRRITAVNPHSRVRLIIDNWVFH